MGEGVNREERREETPGGVGERDGEGGGGESSRSFF